MATRRGLGTGTYSIVGCDSTTNEMGVAVQTHWFAVGAVVPWLAAGVGVVATQANVNVAFGPQALDLLRGGASAAEALEQVLAADPGAAGRQLAVLDAAGGVAAFSGDECFPFAGHETDEGWSCQANLMASPEVWPAMAASFRSSSGPLGDRLLDALRAGQAAGGDVRGLQSAALETVPIDGEPGQRLISLRVDDHPAPLDELARLLDLHRAYDLASQADWALGEGRADQAATLYERASKMTPGNHELLFWAGLGAAEIGDMELALERVRQAISMHPGWRGLLGRLPESVVPAAASVAKALAEKDRLEAP